MNLIPRPLVCFLRAMLLLVLLTDASQGAGFRKEPYLFYTTRADAMKVVWQADATPTTNSLVWGTTTNYGFTAPALTSVTDQVYEYVITNLSANTRYYYRVKVDGNTQTGSFRSVPPDNQRTLTFYATGDTRTQPDVMERVLSTISADIASNATERQTFSFLTGDWVGSGTSETDWDTHWFDNRSGSVQFRATVPVMGVIGNHDVGSLYKKYIRQNYPNDQASYGSISYGLLLAVYLDNYTDYSPGSAQYNWLVGQLSSNQNKHVVVAFHQPGWSAGGHGNDTSVQNYLQPLFQQYGVKLVLNGHNHYYSRCLVNGVNHVVCGGGGAPSYSTDSSWANVVYAEMTYNMVRIEINRSQVTATAFRDNGTVIETFSFTGPEFGMDVIASGVTNIGYTNATLKGVLEGAEGQTNTVWAYYGTSDGGTNASAWTYVKSLGVVASTNITAGISNLQEYTSYRFRFSASNSVDGVVWSEVSGLFVTLSTVPVATSGGINISEGNGPEAWALIPVSVSGALTGTGSVNFATMPETAQPGTDYVPTNGTLYFTSGSPLTQYVTVEMLADLIAEGKETFNLILSSPTGVVLGANGSCTIFDDDTPEVFQQRIATGNDDAEEYGDAKSMNLNSTDLELCDDTPNVGAKQWIGMRFNQVAIPQGVQILKAYVQFTAKESQTGTSPTLSIWGQAADNASAFSNSTGYLSTRTRTSAYVSWNSIATWPSADSAGTDQQTPDLKPILQELVNRPGWNASNALVLLIDDPTDAVQRRTAYSYDGNSAKAPLLYVEYSAVPSGLPIISNPSAQPLGTNSQAVVAVPLGASWRYRDTGEDLGTAWSAASYNDSAWSSGAARLGFGGDGETTTLSKGPAAPNQYLTYYFRYAFTLTNGMTWSNATLNVSRDDGAVIYMNGSEVLRDNMPAGSINYQTVSSATVGGVDETNLFSFTNISVQTLHASTNVIAAEVHQRDGSSSDMGFNLKLTVLGLAQSSWTPAGATNITTTSALLQGDLTDAGLAPVTVSVFWGLTDGGTNPAAWTGAASAGVLPVGSVSILAQGLTSETAYYYRFFASNSYGVAWAQAPGYFVTAPGVPRASINDIVATEGTGTNTAAAFEVTLTSSPSNTVTVSYATDDDTAFGGTDYLPTSGLLTFMPTSALTQVISVPVIADSLAEDDESFALVLSTPSGLTIGKSRGACTLTDDDQAMLIERRIASSSDDAEQYGDTGTMSLNSTDLELCDDTGNLGPKQWVGMRFTQVGIPSGATVLNAYIQFTTKENQSGTSPALQIWGHAADSATTFATDAMNISGRARTTANVSWTNIAAWPTADAVGADQKTPQLKSIVQEIVSRPGWSISNSLAILIDDPSDSLLKRTAFAFDGNSAKAALLQVEYTFATSAIPTAISNPATHILDGAAVTSTPVNLGSTWRYIDNGSDLGSAWRNDGYDDSGWSSGPARLGFGGDGETTILNKGPAAPNQYITYYFSQTFSLDAGVNWTNARLRSIYDDGMIAYINGAELLRIYMPGGSVNYLTLASNIVSAPQETTVSSNNNLSATAFRPGVNRLTVEVHQVNNSSSDLGFDLALDLLGIEQSGWAVAGASNVTTTSAVVYGELTSAGSGPVTVGAYYGFSDGGVSAGAWTSVEWLGTQAVGPVSIPLTNLTSGAGYFFRLVASNSQGIAWAPEAGYFETSAGGVTPAWTAYNDLCWTNGQLNTRITQYGESPAGGALVNGDTGEILPATVSFSGMTPTRSLNTATPDVGTDADLAFAGRVSMDGYLLWGTGSVSITFANLDPQARYHFALYGARGQTNYTYRWNDVMLTVGDVFTNASSAGTAVLTTTRTNDTTRVLAANAEGRLARFTDIQPASDGRIVLTVTAGGSSSTSAYVNAFLLGLQAGDSLYDAWADQHFGGSTTNTAADEDWDADGFANYNEYRAGTDPTNASSKLKLTDQTLNTTNAVLLLRWSSVSGKSYSVQSSDRLTQPWSNRWTGIQATNSYTTQPITTSVQQVGHFWRVTVE